MYIKNTFYVYSLYLNCMRNDDFNRKNKNILSNDGVELWKTKRNSAR